MQSLLSITTFICLYLDDQNLNVNLENRCWYFVKVASKYYSFIKSQRINLWCKKTFSPGKSTILHSSTIYSPISVVLE